MKKMVFALTLALALGVCGAAVAEQGVAYGVYSLGNEQPAARKDGPSWMPKRRPSWAMPC